MNIQNAIVGREGLVLFRCSKCGAPFTRDDFFELGLRDPDVGESQDDYFSAELIDELIHAACSRERAG